MVKFVVPALYIVGLVLLILGLRGDIRLTIASIVCFIASTLAMRFMPRR